MPTRGPKCPNIWGVATTPPRAAVTFSPHDRHVTMPMPCNHAALFSAFRRGACAVNRRCSALRVLAQQRPGPHCVGQGHPSASVRFPSLDADWGAPSSRAMTRVDKALAYDPERGLLGPCLARVSRSCGGSRAEMVQMLNGPRAVCGPYDERLIS